MARLTLPLLAVAAASASAAAAPAARPVAPVTAVVAAAAVVPVAVPGAAAVADEPAPAAPAAAPAPSGRRTRRVVRDVPEAAHAGRRLPRVATPRPTGPPPRRPWDGKAFATPEEVARYVADAYNAGDERALRRVTTPAARRVLDSVRPRTPALVVLSRRCSPLATGAHFCMLGPPDGVTGDHVRLEILRGGPYGWYWDVVDDC